MKALVILALVIPLTGCELLQKNSHQEPPEVLDLMLSTYCTSQESMATFEEYCELKAWADKLIEASTTAWPERSKLIDSLGDEPKQLLEKVLLSQSEDTPYRNRLRAQNWIVDLQTRTDKAMTQVLDVIIFSQSQQLLELESAITILSEVNGRQAKTIASQEVQLEEKNKEIENQRKQVEQLLDIEASMVNQNRSDNK